MLKQWWINLPLYAQIIYGIAGGLIFIYSMSAIIKPGLLLQSLKGVWLLFKEVIKQLNNWRGWLSFGIVWLVMSGVGLMVLGFILRLHILISVGMTILIFWTGPATPLIPIVLMLAMVIQRYVFRDISVKPKLLKDEFVKGFKVKTSYIMYAWVDKRMWL